MADWAMTLIARVRDILLTPRSEWRVIEHERGDATYLFLNYVAILAAIPAVAGFIGTSLIGVSVPTAGTVRVPIAAGLVNAVLAYFLSFGITYCVALASNALAPTFGGQQNFGKALKLIVYSFTPAWLAGISIAIPSLQFLGILGLYAAVLLWIGVPQLMKVPTERATSYAALLIVIIIAVALVLALLQVSLLGFG
jgi:hypothetical protein